MNMIDLAAILVLSVYSCFIGTALYVTRNVNIPHNRNSELNNLIY
jgi:hypothetical protein